MYGVIEDIEEYRKKVDSYATYAQAIKDLIHSRGVHHGDDAAAYIAVYRLPDEVTIILRCTGYTVREIRRYDEFHSQVVRKDED